MTGRSPATILTVDGLYFDYNDPGEGISLNAIARGLANTCRFAGQCEKFYSVAEHSIWVSRIVPPEHAWAGLLHDAAEAFICDMPKPLKVLLSDYQAVEQRIERVIFQRYGVPYPLPVEVKHADRVMLGTEQRQIMQNRDLWQWVEPPRDDIVLECAAPDEAVVAFMARAQQIREAGLLPYIPPNVEADHPAGRPEIGR